MIAALFVQPRGCYSKLPDVDPWPEKRDARLYEGPWPVVAHPPCARWCLLAGMVQAISGYKVGDDGGTFDSALRSVRRFGGVLEHPAWTKAWAAHGLPEPPNGGGWLREMFGPGWVCSVSQRPYGHRAAKQTWLYYVGELAPFELDWSRPESDAYVSEAGRSRAAGRLRGVAVLGKRERDATPPAFRDTLLALARRSRPEAA